MHFSVSFHLNPCKKNYSYKIYPEHLNKSSLAHLQLYKHLTQYINVSASAHIWPCHCLQTPGSQFSSRLTLKKRLVNHILGLSPRPQSVSVAPDCSNCASPRLQAGSARLQRPLSWACVCSHPKCENLSLQNKWQSSDTSRSIAIIRWR